MTGYGSSSGVVAGREVTVEVRCYNHRFKDVRVRLPQGWMALEVPVENLVRGWMGRGRVECLVRAKSGAATVGKPNLDGECAREFLRIYGELAREIGTEDKPTLDLLAQSTGVIVFQENIEDVDAAWSELEILIDKTMLAADRMRISEGREISREIHTRLDELQRICNEIQAMLPSESEAAIQRTCERIRSLAGQTEISPDRLAQEMAILAERMDVTEELTRLAVHDVQFRELLGRDQPVGRELDFLLQEMNREANTLAAKMHSAAVIGLAVSLKAEVEKIREQVQNVE